MNVEDELRRLLTDDRLDVPVKAGATDVIVAGARRIRRRRGAAVGAFVATSLVAVGFGVWGLGMPTSLPPAESVLPTTSSTTAAVPSTVTMRETVVVTVTRTPAPDIGYGQVKFGMSGQEVAATGLVAEAPGGECAAFTWLSDPATPDAVLVSPTRGVVAIKLPSGATTSTGIGVGSAVADLQREYPAGREHGGVYRVAMTGGEIGWTYVFRLGAGVVKDIGMRRLTADCGEQGEQ